MRQQNKKMLMSLGLATFLIGCAAGPDLEPADAAPQYQEYCQFAIPHLGRFCGHLLDCGYVDKAGFESCVHFAEDAITGRCGQPLEHPSADYAQCLADWDSLTCALREPISCGDIWE